MTIKDTQHQNLVCLVDVDLAKLEKRFKGDGKDFHTETASLIFGVPEDQVTKDQRMFAKKQNYFNMYSPSVTK